MNPHNSTICPGGCSERVANTAASSACRIRRFFFFFVILSISEKGTYNFPLRFTQLKVEGPVPILTQHARSAPIIKAAISIWAIPDSDWRSHTCTPEACPGFDARLPAAGGVIVFMPESAITSRRENMQILFSRRY
jgi:hypothetical protein